MTTTLATKTGFYARMYGRDCFFETDRKNKTDALALEFINKVQNSLNRFTNVSDREVEYIKHSMLRATMEHKQIDAGSFAGLEYINISGENFSGYGCNPCADPFSVCCIV